MVYSERELLQGVKRELIERYGYSPSQIDLEVQISERLRADCVVYVDETKKQPLMVIEVKSPLLYPIAVEQLATCIRLINATYGILTNGVRKFFFRLVGNEIVEISNIPKKGEKEAKIVSKRELKPASDFDYRLHEMYDYIYSNEKLPSEDVLEEIQKLMLCKLEDEKSANDVSLFSVSPHEVEKIGEKRIEEAVANRIERLFTKVKMHYPQLYSRSESLKLSPRTLYYGIAQLQNYSLSKTPNEVIASAYSQFISKSMYGYLGQYFTPKPLVDFVIKLLDPNMEEIVLDPACGSGSFLISILHHVWKKRLNRIQGANTMLGTKADYASNRIFGIDINSKMISICKMNMLLQGDGHSNIFQADFLSNLPFLEKIKPGGFDIVVVDPPSGEMISDRVVLRNFELGKARKAQQIHVLFLEKCINLLKPKGRMAIVIPDSLLTSPSFEYVRSFTLQKTLVRAIINIPARTFIPYSGIKTNVLLLERKMKTRKYADYDVFMAEASDAKVETLDEIVESYKNFMKRG